MMQGETSRDKEEFESQAAEIVSRTNRNNEDEQSRSEPEDDAAIQDDEETKKKDEDKRYRKTQIQTKKERFSDLQETNTEGIFLYKPGVELPNLFPFLQTQIKIIIAAQYINKRNPEFIRKNVCGNEAYTSNSDAVCMAVHFGFININTFSSKKFEGVELTCKVVRPKKSYVGVIKNGIPSKGIKNYDGNALKPEAIKNLNTLPPIQILEKYAANMNIPVGTKRTKSKPRCLSSIVPIPETHIVFNMNNEPAYKYSIFNIADKGFDKNQLVIKKLDHHALYLETDDAKYEVVKMVKDLYFDFIKISKVKNPERADNEFFSKTPLPLAADLVEVIEEGAEWDQVIIGNTSIRIKNTEIQGLRSFKYYKMDARK